MTVSELIAMLRTMPVDLEVTLVEPKYAEDVGIVSVVTGIEYDDATDTYLLTTAYTPE